MCRAGGRAGAGHRIVAIGIVGSVAGRMTKALAGERLAFRAQTKSGGAGSEIPVTQRKQGLAKLVRWHEIAVVVELLLRLLWIVIGVAIAFIEATSVGVLAIDVDFE